jgi:hypothetical protein
MKYKDSSGNETEVTKMMYNGEEVNIHWHDGNVVFAKAVENSVTIDHEYVKQVEYTITRPDEKVVTGVIPETPVDHTETSNYSLNLRYLDDLSLKAIARDTTTAVDDDGDNMYDTIYTAENPDRSDTDVLYTEKYEYSFGGTKMDDYCYYYLLTVKHKYSSMSHILYTITNGESKQVTETVGTASAGKDGAQYSLKYGVDYQITAKYPGYSNKYYKETVAGNLEQEIEPGNYIGGGGGTTEPEQPEQPTTKYRVRFYDTQNNVILNDEVEYGDSVTPPYLETVYAPGGYAGSWKSTGYTNVTQDLDIYPKTWSTTLGGSVTKTDISASIQSNGLIYVYLPSSDFTSKSWYAWSVTTARYYDDNKNTFSLDHEAAIRNNSGDLYSIVTLTFATDGKSVSGKGDVSATFQKLVAG